MNQDTLSGALLFEVETPLGFRVHVTRAYWELIITVKHPVMAGREADVQATLQSPDEIRVSRRDPKVFLFYKRAHWALGVCGDETT